MLHVRHATLADISEVQQLIKDSFDLAVAPLYSEEGKQEFYKYIVPNVISKRLEKEHIILIAEETDQAVGIIELREYKHISMFFIREDRQRQGVGRILLQKAVQLCQRHDPNLKKLTVHSSPNSISAYISLGFQVISPEQSLHGIRFVTMELAL